MVKVRMVETNNPPISAIDIGEKNELRERISGINPNIVVTELNKIGRILFSTESIHASLIFNPFFLALFIYSIKSIALFTTIPNKLAIPRPTVKVKWVLVIISAAIIPINDNGIVTKIIIGCFSELNCIKRII